MPLPMAAAGIAEVLKDVSRRRGHRAVADSQRHRCLPRGPHPPTMRDSFAAIVGMVGFCLSHSNRCQRSASPRTSPRQRMRSAPALAALLLLSACAATHQPMGPAIQAASLAPDVLQTYDGIRLPMRHWQAAGQPRAVVVALHGMNDYSRAFEQPARWWAERGVSTYAFDQRGFGAAPRPGIWPDTPTLAADLDAAIDALRARYPTTPLFVLGESMGGAVAIAATTRTATRAGEGPPRTQRQTAPGRVSGVILSAPALWGRQTMNPLFRLTLWAGYHIMPGKHLTPPRGLRIVPSDNREMLIALGRDPLVIKRTRLDALHGLVDLMTQAYEGVEHWPPGLPVLVMYGQHEQVLNRDAVTRMVERTRAGALGADSRLAVYPDGYHLLMRDLCAHTVWADVLAWMQDPHAPLPSGADRTAWTKAIPPRPPQPPTCAAGG